MPLNDYIPHPLNISVGKVVKVLDGAAPPAKADNVTPHADEKPVPGTTAAAPGESGVQKLDKGLNWKATVPVEVPVEKRAKGGPVKAGGAPMKNVDNSGMTKEKC